MGVENGVWIESFTSATPGLTAAPEQAQQEEAPAVNMMYYQRLMMERYGLRAPGAAPTTEGEPSPAAATPKTPAASTNEIAVITIKCRGLNLKKFSPTANDDLAFAVQNALLHSPLVDTNETKLSGPIEQVDETNSVTFSFGLTLKLKHPMKL